MPSQHKPLILVLEPDIHVLEDRRTQLKAAGYEVLAAKTGKDGLALFVASPVELAMIAGGLSDMTGEFVAAWIKTINPRIPVMMFSPPCRPSRRQRRYVDAFLSTTDPWPEILSAINKQLQSTTAFWDRWWREWTIRARSGPRKPQPLDYPLSEWWKSG